MDLFRGINDNSNDDNNNNSNNSRGGNARPKFLSMAMPAPQRMVAAPRQDSLNDGAGFKRQAWQEPTMDKMSMNQQPNKMFTIPHDGKTTTVIEPSSSWASIDKLTRLGYFHPLETTHTKFPFEDLPQVLARLTRTMRQLSCCVDHESDRVVALAQTMEGVEFQIAVWQGRKGTADADSCVLELQRVSGDCMCFHRKYAATLLKVPQVVVNNEAEQAAAEDETMMETEFTVDVERRDALLMDALLANSPCPVDEIAESLEMACDLFTNDRCDASRLGLESLQSLADPRSSGWQTALRVSRGIVQHHIVPKLWRCAMHQDNMDSLVALQIWTTVWQVLAQAAQKHGDEEAASCAMMQLPPDAIPALLTHVSRAQSHPHHAALACSALQALAQLDATVARQITWHTVSTAHAVGCAQHASLQFASQQLLMESGAVRS